MSKFEDIIKKLDLEAHIARLVGLFAREKSVIMGGDTTIHAKFIKALDKIDLPTIKEVSALDDSILRLSKDGVLRLNDIYEFVKIVEFFNKLKATSLPAIWSEYLASVDIPKEILEITTYFRDDGLLESSKIEELFDVENSLKNIKQHKKDRLISILNSSSLSSYLVDSQVHLYYGQESLLVRGGFSRVLKANVIGRSSGGFFYVVPHALEELTNKESRMLDLKEEIYQKWAKEFSSIFAKWWRFLQFLNKEFDRVDHYFARAMFLRGRDFALMLPNKGKTIKLAAFAHPAIANVVPIDIEFKNQIMLITGVNAGGKTMLLKSILSAALMSKYLIPFSCNEHKTQIGSFDKIEAILDDPQSVKNDISTFAGRMVEFRKLFKLKNAIIGVDEIELGTDADEAAALFRSLLEELSSRGLYFIITTHHKRLASLMASKDNVELIAAIYDEEKRVPTYTYLSGSIGKSYAFETALRYGIDALLVKRAREFLGQDKEQLSKLIEQSTQLEINMRQKVKEAKEALKSAQEKEQKLEALKQRLMQEQKDALSELELKYQKALKDVQSALKKAENPDARRLLNRAHKAKSDAKIKEQPKKELNLKVGLSVKYKGMQASIISIKSKEVLIEANGMKLRVPKSELRAVESTKKVKKPKPVINVSVAKPQNSKISLKLLGYRADEAEEEVHNFLSNALLQGFSEIEIIHGSGAGVLSKVVSELLKKHPKVKSFERVKGNLGATIVKL